MERFAVRMTGFETLQQRSPLFDFLKYQILPLKDSVSYLVQCLPQYQTVADYAAFSMTAVDKAAAARRGLSVDAAACIYLYTLEFTVKPSFFSLLNEALRAVDRNLLTPYFPLLRLLLHGLTTLPRLPSDSFFRGVSVSHLDCGITQIGQQITWWAVTSASCNFGKIMQFTAHSPQRTFFVIKTDQAVSVSEFSSFSQEEEVILLPGSTFMVIAISELVPGVHTVQLQQVPSQLIT